MVCDSSVDASIPPQQAVGQHQKLPATCNTGSINTSNKGTFSYCGSVDPNRADCLCGSSVSSM